MKPLILSAFLFFVLLADVSAQVDAIKHASSSHSSSHHESGGYSSGGGGSSGGFYFGVAVQSVQMFSVWQAATLQKRDSVPTVVSFDVMLQTAIQPSSYYIVNPRIRGNWGIFSTDFRFNYLIEEAEGGTKSIRTDDWQIIQLNVVTAKNVTLRVGGGTIHENFSGGKTYPEWTVGLHLFSNHQKLGGMTEFRWSEPRNEWNGFVHYRLFDQGRLHGFVTGGIMYQRYYNTISVWGMQGGLMFRFY